MTIDPFPRCTGCNSRLNVWHITLCHTCANPVAAQPKTLLHLIKSDEADRPLGGESC